MPPQESTQLLPSDSEERKSTFSFGLLSESFSESSSRSSTQKCYAILLLAVVAVCGVIYGLKPPSAAIPPPPPDLRKFTGPYKLLESQKGKEFFDFYSFYDGPDSLGSAGYNVYVGKERALELGIANVTRDDNDEEFVYMSSAPTEEGPREAVRLEGNRRFDRGLFILDLDHMPAGCGVWPAFWMTDEDAWPDNGEIDVVEGINNQQVAKTALHTSASCSMYAHVADYDRTGVWDQATGIPDTFTGKLNTINRVEADNCWNMAAHQWANQGCVTVSTQNGTLGEPVNAKGGGVYVLEWDPANRYIRSWVFTPHGQVPENLQAAMDTATEKDAEKQVMPDPSEWGLPYAYFAIGETTGCSSDHFKNMRIVFNLAFCGNVAGNRFGRDCPAEAEAFGGWDPVSSCNAFIQSEPDILDEAYWKIRGVYVYERDFEETPMKGGEPTNEEANRV